MKFCTIDNLKLSDRILCVAEDSEYTNEDCTVLTKLIEQGKTQQDCKHYKKYKIQICNCAKTVEKILKEKYGKARLDMVEFSQHESKINVPAIHCFTHKFATENGSETQTLKLAPKFCPFCGKKYV